MNMHLAIHRQITVFSSLKFINKMEYSQRIASPMRKKFEIRPCEEFEFLIRRQEYNLQTRKLFLHILNPLVAGVELGPVSRSCKELTFGSNIKNNFSMLGLPKYILLKRKWVTI